jgi:hypothetical protein
MAFAAVVFVVSPNGNLTNLVYRTRLLAALLMSVSLIAGGSASGAGGHDRQDPETARFTGNAWIFNGESRACDKVIAQIGQVYCAEQ